MDELEAEAGALCAQADALGIEVRLVGGLAVRALVGPSARETYDIDVVARDARARELVGEWLVQRGYRLMDDPGWWRAVRGAIIVDLAAEAVVDPKTLERFVLDWSRPAERRRLAGAEVSLASEAELATAKLLAGRVHDLLDLALVVGRRSSPAPDAVREVARRAGVEPRLAAQAAKLRFDVHLGRLEEAAREALGHGLPDAEREALERWLDALAAGEP